VNTHCDIQTHFSFRADTEIRIDFDGGQITSDAGLLPLREFDHRIGFTDQIAECICDDRHPSYVKHELAALIIQRFYGMVAGYEDQNDADRLRHDGTFQTIAGKDLGDALASQPSISRFENSISASEVGELNDLLVETFVAHHAPPVIIIDVDSTDDPTHGQQQFSAFNGFYNQHMYRPLLIHEGLTGCILGTFLRPGNAHDTENLLAALKPIITRLREAFPYALIDLRADAGFEGPKLYDFCETNNVGFTVGVGTNQALKRKSDELQQQASSQYQASGEKAKLYDHFAHQAGSWQRHLRVLVKVEAGPEGINRRFVVTNRPGDPRRLFDFYEGRGQAENYIKELKNDFKADRLSCSRFEANCFRLVLFALAYQLINIFRGRLANPYLRRAQVQTLRVKLFKVGALVQQSSRRIWLHLASGWPHQSLLQQVIRDVSAHSPPR